MNGWNNYSKFQSSSKLPIRYQPNQAGIDITLSQLSGSDIATRLS